MKNTQHIGHLTEQRCFLKCMEMGFIVSRPLFDDARYDFILDIGVRLLRIQVKSSHWCDDEKSVFEFNGYSQHSNGKANKRMKYTKDEIDYFMTEIGGVFYLIPVEENGFGSKKLRIAAKQDSQPSITWAREYVFEKIINGDLPKLVKGAHC